MEPVSCILLPLLLEVISIDSCINASAITLDLSNFSVADLGEGPAGRPPSPLFWVEKKKPHKGETPAGASKSKPPPPPP